MKRLNFLLLAFLAFSLPVNAYQVKTSQGITDTTILINPSTGAAYTSVPVTISGGGGSGGTTVAIDQTTNGTTNAVSVKTAPVTTTTMQSAVSATGNGTSLDVSGKSVAVLQVTGTFVATVDFEASVDDTNWSSINATKLGADQLMINTTSTGIYRLSVAGLKSVRARVTWTSGTSVTVTGYATFADSHAKLVATANTGHAYTITVTRPANQTPYSAGDALGDTGGSAILAIPNMCRVSTGCELMITSIELEPDIAAVPSGMTGFNVRLYNASPTAIADNAAWDFVSGDRGKYLGKILLGTPVDEGSTLFIDNDGLNKQVTLSSSTLYVIIQTVAGFTPAANSETYRLTIHATEI